MRVIALLLLAACAPAGAATATVDMVVERIVNVNGEDQRSRPMALKTIDQSRDYARAQALIDELDALGGDTKRFDPLRAVLAGGNPDAGGIVDLGENPSRTTLGAGLGQLMDTESGKYALTWTDTTAPATLCTNYQVCSNFGKGVCQSVGLPQTGAGIVGGLACNWTCRGNVEARKGRARCEARLSP